MSVIYNTQSPDYTLKGKSNPICYHKIKEIVATEELLTTHIPKNENPSVLMMKVIAGQKRQKHISNFLNDIHD